MAGESQIVDVGTPEFKKKKSTTLKYGENVIRRKYRYDALKSTSK